MKPALIVNPISGRGRRRKLWREFGLDAETVTTRAPGDAVRLAREMADAGYDPVIAAGGDGTVNEVVNGILSSRARPALGVLPCGTAGDFARSLGITARNAAEAIRRARMRTIDAALATPGAGQPRWFVNMVSAGLGGEVARRRFGGYLPSALRTVLTRGPWEISIDGETSVLLHVAVGNTPWQGAGMNICPGADPADGLLDITTIAPLGLFELARDLRVIYSSAIHRHPKVRHWRVERVRLSSPAAVLYDVDGDLGGSLPLEITVSPGALRVIVPYS